VFAESLEPWTGAALASGALDHGLVDDKSSFAAWSAAVGGLTSINHLLGAELARDVARERRQGEMTETRVRYDRVKDKR